MPARAIAFDNSVVSALVKSAVDPRELGEADKERAKLARNMLDKIRAANAQLKQEDRTKIHIPIPAITECLAGWPIEQHVNVLQELRTIGSPCYFDDKAAIIAARVHRELISRGRKPEKGVRQIVKFDVMIAACAMSADVATLYHADDHFDAYADLDVFSGKLAFEGLPRTTQDLFEGMKVATSEQEQPGEKAQEEPPEETGV